MSDGRPLAAASGAKFGMQSLLPLLRLFKSVLGEKRCLACLAPVSPDRVACGLCPDCMAALPPHPENACPLCAAPLPGFHPDTAAQEALRRPILCGSCLTGDRPPWEAAYCYGPYAGLLRDLLLRFKFHREVHLATVFASLLAGLPELQAWLHACPFGATPILVPIPLDPARHMERGFNQAHELGGRLAALLELPLKSGILVRVRQHTHQPGSSREERTRNVRGAFQVTPAPFARVCAGKNLLLLDDIYTTGATLREAARTLLAAGAGSVRVLAVARTSLQML